MLYIERFAQIAKRYPKKIAIIDNGISISYENLMKKTAGIGEVIKSFGINENSIVAINLPKSIDYIASLLGIWYAGAAFVPIDPTLPQDRSDYMVKEASPKLIITKEWMKSIVDSEIWIPTQNSQTDLAYLIFTSGSSGKPKGVLINHSGICPFLDDQIEAFKITDKSSSLFYLSTSFDASISDIGTILLKGATLIIEPQEKLESITELVETLKEYKISHLDLPPSLLRLLDPEKMPSSLQCLIIGGEPTDPAVVRNWSKFFNVINVYGPTETTVCSSLVKCDHQNWLCPIIGNPIAGLEYLILNEELSESEIGELYITGPGVARGYLNRMDLNEIKFPIVRGQRYFRTGDKVCRHSNGDYEFLGRIDRQIKIRGLRIEPEEIENVLKEHPGIFEAVITKQPDREILIAFITLKDPFLTTNEIREHLKSKLPLWMIPGQIEILEHFQRTPTGKIDIQELKSDTESLLARMWKKILKVSIVNRDSHFFQLGGDSFSLIEFIVEAEKAGIVISSSVVKMHPTLKELTSHLHLNEKMSIENLKKAIPSPYQKRPSNHPYAIFLTGATGNLGHYLLQELLIHTSARIYCLVRSVSINNLQSDERIIPVIGDLSLPHFGVERWDELADMIDVVYHCAADVNMIKTFEELRSVNLDATEQIIQFCRTGRPKVLHYASTLSVFVATDQNEGSFLESDDLSFTKHVYGGYAQTKWASEILLRRYLELGVPVSIYRFGLITGHTQTGKCSPDDFLSLFIKGLISIGMAPLGDYSLDVTPIDYAAKAMCHLSLKAPVNTYHIANKTSLTLIDLVNYLNQCGYSIKQVPPELWRKEILDKENLSDVESATFLALCRASGNISSFEKQRTMDLFQATNTNFDRRNTLKELMGTDISCPLPDQKLINKYITFLSENQ